MVKPSAFNRRRDAIRNRRHRRALQTISRFMGTDALDYAEFLHGELVSGWTCPF
ncbi:hypothetical protein [Halochromatium salexigens]|uniref:hypothetical protein n=1 Tax=Halochromatium salexigens TaxID=49447 RepID=UPI0019133C98|nr:hypothetical protein [Halochromatium salexigens]